MRNDSPAHLRQPPGETRTVDVDDLTAQLSGIAVDPTVPARPGTLLGATEVRRLAAQLDLRPTKTLGQNFVHDANTVRRIAAVARLDDSAHVLEIGPGLGSLTLALLEVAAIVTAVEIDERLADLLPVTVSAHAPDRSADLTVITADALQLSGADIPGEPTALVANLPYNVAVPVLLHLLAELPSLRRVLVMVQAEVADRLAAPPGSRTYGSPSAKAAWYGTTKRAGAIARSVFWPVPGVDSALVAIDRHAVPRSGDRRAVFAVIDAAFAQRRKTLRAALAGWAGSPVRAEQILRTADVDPGLRGEMLDVDAFARIAAAAVSMPGAASDSTGHLRGTLTDAMAHGPAGVAQSGPADADQADGA